MARLVSRLTIFADSVDDRCADALSELADFILNLIRIFAPVDTGALRDSYDKDEITPLHILIGTAIEYGKWQEFGTRKMSAQPHVLPAFHIGEKEAAAIFRKHFQGVR